MKELSCVFECVSSHIQTTFKLFVVCVCRGGYGLPISLHTDSRSQYPHACRLHHCCQQLILYRLQYQHALDALLFAGATVVTALGNLRMKIFFFYKILFRALFLLKISKNIKSANTLSIKIHSTAPCVGHTF